MAENNNNNEYLRKVHERVGQKYAVGSFDSFVESLKNPEKRKKAYDYLSNKYLLDDFETFDNKIKGMVGEVKPTQQSSGSYIGDVAERLGAGAANFAGGALTLAQKVADKGLFSGVGLAGKLLGAGNIYGKGMGKAGEYLKNKGKEWKAASDRYKGKTFFDLAKEGRYGEAMGDLFLGATESLPVSLGIMLTGGTGLAATGAVTASDKYDELRKQNPNMSEAAALGNSVVTGISEAVSEMLGPGVIGKTIKGLYMAGGKKAAAEAMEKGIMDKLTQFVDKHWLAYPIIEEGLTEAVNAAVEYGVDTLTGVERTDNFLQTITEAAGYGAAGGAQFTPVVGGFKYMNKRRKDKATRSYNDNLPVGEQLLGENLEQFNAAVTRFQNENRPEQIQNFVNEVARAKGLDNEQTRNLIDYTGSLLNYNNYINSVQEQIEEETRKAYDEIDRTANRETNTVMLASMSEGSEPVYVTGGNLVLGNDGQIDYDNSSSTIYYLDENGKVKQGTPQMFATVVSNTPVETLYTEAALSVNERITQQEDNDIRNASFNNGDNVVLPTGETGVVQQYDDDGNLLVNIGGEIRPVAPEGVMNAEEAATVQAEQQAQQEVAEQQQMEMQYPRKGEDIDYSAITDPNMYASALQSEFGEEAGTVLDEMIADKQAELEKSSKGKDAITRRRATNKINSELSLLNEARNIITPVQTEEVIEQVNDNVTEPTPVSEDIEAATAEVPTAEETLPEQETQPAEQSLIPTNEQGVPQYHLTSIDNTLDDLLDGSMSIEEVNSFVDENIKAAESELKEVEKRKPVMGISKFEYLAQRDAIQEELNNARQKVEYWNNVKKEITPEEPGSQSLDKWMMEEPMNLQELAAQMLASGRLKLLQSDYKKQTGYGNKEARKMFGIFASEANGGVSLEKAGEIIELRAREEGLLSENQEIELNSGFEALMDVLTGSSTKGDINSYVANNRERILREEREYQEGQEAAIAEQAYGMSLDDYRSYVDATERNIRQSQITDEQYNELQGEIYDEMMAREQEFYEEIDEALEAERQRETEQEVEQEEYIENESREFDSINQGSDGVLPETQINQEGRSNVPQESEQTAADIVGEDGATQGNEVKASPIQETEMEMIDRIANEQNEKQRGKNKKENLSKRKVSKINKVNKDDYITSTEREQIKALIESGLGEGYVGNSHYKITDISEDGVYTVERTYESTDNTTLVRDKDGKLVGKRRKVKTTIKVKPSFVNEENLLTKRAKEWESKVGVPVEIMENINDVSNAQAKEAISSGKTITGWYDVKADKVYIYLPNIASEAEIDKTYIHEIVAHKGLRGLLGDKFDSFMDNVWDSMSEQDQTRFMNYPGVKNKRDAADEYVAFLSESTDVESKSVWDKIVSSLKDFLRDLGINISMSDADIREALRDSYKRLKEGNEALNTDEYGVRFREVTDPKELEFLENQEKVKVYRAMQVIDGKLYPPMAAAMGGKLIEPIELNKWEKAVERPELAIPDIDSKTGKQKVDKKTGELVWKFVLDKGGKDATGKKATPIPARYNPYIHTSRSPLNDQFKSAWIRPNLVTVEVEVPVSELTSGYKAERAKDAVGEVEWKSGSVSGELAKVGKTRRVILSRWDKPVRVLDNSEVAERIAELIGDNDIAIPENVVTPQLRVELEKRGVKIGDPEKGVNKNEQVQEALKSGLLTDNSLVRFREVGNNLVALHNLSEESLKNALELGGFPMPSIAVTTKEIGHTEFGDISLLFDKSTINPSDSRNRLYAGDAWTPTFPEVRLKISESVAERIRNKVKGLLKDKEYTKDYSLHIDNDNMTDAVNRSGNFRDAYKMNEAMQIAFLADKGVSFKPVLVEKKYSSKVDNETLKEIVKATGKKASELANLGYDGKMELEPVVRKVVDAYKEKKDEAFLNTLEESKRPVVSKLLKAKLGKQLSFSELDNLFYAAFQYDKNGEQKVPDRAKTYEKLKAKFTKKLQSEYESWLDELSEGIIEKKGIRNERDMFTSSGNRRSWEALYDEVTLDNVVRAMSNQSETGGAGLFGGSIFGAAQKEISSIEELKDLAKQRLAEINSEEYEAEKSDIMDRLSNIDIPGRSNSFGSIMDMIENIIDAVKKSHKADGIYKYLKKYYPRVTKEIAKEIEDIVKDIQAMSTRYFEAKPYRAVRFDEVKAAVVPRGTDKGLIEQLEKRGIPVKTYKKGDTEAMKKAVNNAAKSADVLFRFIGETGAANLDRAEEATTRLDNLSVARQMESEGKDAKAIKYATGWERGADNKWRYETADANKIDLAGNVRWLERHPEYKRLSELRKKSNSALILGTDGLTEAEKAEYEELKRNLPDVSLNETQINPDRIRLADIVDDKDLFKAYPQLSDIEVKITPLGEGYTASVVKVGNVLGEYVRDELRINKDKYDNAIKSGSKADYQSLTSAIEHEIQHLVQDIEGFAQGSSLQYFEKTRNRTLYNSREIENLIEEKHSLMTSFISSDDYKDISFEEVNLILDRAMKDEISYDEAEEKYKEEVDKELQEKFPSFKRHKEAVADIEERIESEMKKPMTTYSAYQRTAGEVEARNVQSRLNMTPEQRRNSLAYETEDVSREDQIFIEDALSSADTRFREPSTKKISGGRKITFTRANPTTTFNALTRWLDKLGIEPKDISKAKTGSKYISFDKDGVEYNVRAANHTKGYYVSPDNNNGVDISWGDKIDGVEIDLAMNEMGISDIQNLIDEVEDINKDLSPKVEMAKERVMPSKKYGVSPVTAAMDKAVEDILLIEKRKIVGDVQGEYGITPYGYITYTASNGVRINTNKNGNNDFQLPSKVEGGRKEAKQAALNEYINSGEYDANMKKFKDADDKIKAEINKINTAVSEAVDMDKVLYRTNMTESEKKQSVVDELSASLNTPITVYNSLEEIVDENPRRQRNKRAAKGWYDYKTGEVFVVMPNNNNAADTQATILHEVVAHKGLRGLLGENFETMMDNIFKNVPKNVRQALVVEALSSYNGNVRIATEEYLARIAEGGIPEPSIWGKIKSAIKEVFRNMGINLVMTDEDIAYLLWKSKNRLNKGDSFKTMLDKAAKDAEMRSTLLYRNSSMRNGTMLNTHPTQRVSMRNTINTLTSRLTPVVKNGYKAFREGYQDRMLPLRDFQEAITEETGHKVADFENAYVYENTIQSKAQYDSNKYKDNVLNPLVAEVAKLSKVNGKVDAEKSRLVESYMMIKHGLERNALMRKRDLDKIENPSPETIEKFNNRDYSGLTALSKEVLDLDTMDEAALTDWVNDFEKSNNTSKLWSLVKTATEATLDKLYQSNMLSRDKMNELKGMYKYYIPLKEWDETTAGEVFDYVEKGYTDKVTNPIKKAKGRTSRAGSVLANIVNDFDNATILGYKNLMKLRLANLVRNSKTNKASVSNMWYVKALDSEGNEVWEPAVPVGLTEDAAKNAKIIADFEEKMQGLAKTGDAKHSHEVLKLGMPIKNWQERQHMIRVKEGGRDMVVYINGDPKVSQAVNGLNRPSLDNSMLQGLNWVKRNMMLNYTSRNINFIARNFIRDMVYTNTMNFVKYGAKFELEYVKNIVPALKALSRKAMGKNAKNAEQQALFDAIDAFERGGGKTGYVEIFGYDKYKREVDKLLRKSAGGNVQVKDVINTVGSFLEQSNDVIENTARFATYLAAKNSGMTELQAIKAAKDVSVNFNRKGSGAMGGIYFQNFYFFFNAAIQGTHNFLSAVKAQPKRAAAAMAMWGMAGFAYSMIMSLYADDDDEYNQIPDYVRQNNLLIPIPSTDKYVLIPLPVELRILFGAGDMFAQASRGEYKGRDFTSDMMAKIMEFSPKSFEGNLSGMSRGLADSPLDLIMKNFTPDAVRPIVDALYFNENFFGKRVSGRNEFNKYVPEFQKVTTGTSKALIKASEKLNEVTGGDYATKGSIDPVLLNPSIAEYLFEQYFGGIGKLISQIYKTSEGAFGDGAELRNIPVVSGLSYDTTNLIPRDYTQQRYEKFIEFYEEAQSRKRMYEKGLFSGEELSENFKAFVSDKDYAKYNLIDRYKKIIDSMYDKAKLPMSDDEKKRIFENVRKLKKEMVKQIDKIDNEE